MAKIKHNNFLDTVDEVISDAKKMRIVHLYTEDEELTVIIPKVAYIQAKDNFSMELMGVMQNK